MDEGDTIYAWTFDAAFSQPNYQIDGQGAARIVSEESTDRRLTLRARVTETVLKDVYRRLKSDEGQVDVLASDDGGLVAVDRANGGNSFVIEPPSRRTPLRQEGTFHVERYEEETVSQDLGEFVVTLELIRDADRTDTPSINEAQSGAAFPWTFPQVFEEHYGWGFTTRYGTIATDRVDAVFLGTGADGVERFEITARLTQEEAHVFEAALSLVGGTRVKEVPDATNLLVDDTGGDATIFVETPLGQTVVGDGDYVVTEWSSERLNEAFQSVSWGMGLSA